MNNKTKIMINKIMLLKMLNFNNQYNNQYDSQHDKATNLGI